MPPVSDRWFLTHQAELRYFFLLDRFIDVNVPNKEIKNMTTKRVLNPSISAMYPPIIAAIAVTT